ncbi:hypothetical protein HPB52_008189 [Rhipicephalus sanguineus]|uniref:Nose resistant-to-fluoxetine protein N-terminal domain-containing protein n=1 Tax=Rhipicephalus sanguineus TaxID=34632 RepID=A0A9D4PVB1_RHISA|nr:hypothetical protein HPB52_008189 [Rhipicephalus sanguineus]
MCVTVVLCRADTASDDNVRNGIIAGPAGAAADDETAGETRRRWIREALDNDVAEYRLSLVQEYTESYDKRTPLGVDRRRRALDLDDEPRAVWSDPEGALTRTAEWFVRKLWMPMQELAGSGALSSKCVSGLLAVYGGVRRGQLWALKFLDATGKFPSGVLTTSSPSSDPGSYDECLDIGHGDPENLAPSDRAPPAMEGRYCSLLWATSAASLVTKISDSEDVQRNGTSVLPLLKLTN